MQKSIEATLESIFGSYSTEHGRYRVAAQLDIGPVVLRSANVYGAGSRHHDLQKAREYLTEGKNRSIKLLREAIRGSKEELAEGEEDVELSPMAISPHSLVSNAGKLELTLHPEVQDACSYLALTGKLKNVLRKNIGYCEAELIRLGLNPATITLEDVA